jgi:hypothetical protein
MVALLVTLVALLGLAAAAGAARKKRRGRPAPPAPIALDAAAEAYTKLVLALGVHDPSSVDAYYGPPAWKDEAQAAGKTLERITSEANALIARLERHPPATSEELVLLRHRSLARQLGAVEARARMLKGTRFEFDEESRRLYDAVSPARSDSEFVALQARLEQLLPGPGSLLERYEAFRRDFVIPPDRLGAVFTAAIEECRARTKRHIALPPGESFIVEYVKDKPWSGYNWYQGGYRSTIQVNTDLPIHIDRAIDLAAHEGYPGHHVYNALIEKELVRDRGWIEFTVYPLFSPMSLIAEGTANFGVDVVFPGPEKLAFETTVLYPLAGLDSTKAARYAEVQRLYKELSYADTEAARGYLNKRVEKQATIEWLGRYRLMAPERANQKIAFYDTYRSYIINYNLGEDIVRSFIEGRGGTPERPEVRWREFTALLATPRLPSELASEGGAATPPAAPNAPAR